LLDVGKAEISGRGQELKTGKIIHKGNKIKTTNIKIKAKQIRRNVNKPEGKRDILIKYEIVVFDEV
jgi:hypothetical protein